MYSPCNKSLQHVQLCELAILLQNLPGCRDQLWSLGQVPVTGSSKCFMWTVCGTSPCDQSLCVNSSEGWLQGLVTGTSPLICANLYAMLSLMVNCWISQLSHVLFQYMYMHTPLGLCVYWENTSDSWEWDKRYQHSVLWWCHEIFFHGGTHSKTRHCSLSYFLNSISQKVLQKLLLWTFWCWRV